MPELLKDKVIFITGASRGVGRAIALRAAQDGARIVVAAKTVEPNPKIPGTIHSVAAEIEAAGGKALPLALDIRDEDRVEAAVAEVAVPGFNPHLAGTPVMNVALDVNSKRASMTFLPIALVISIIRNSHA